MKVKVWLMAIDMENSGIWVSAYPTKTARDGALAAWIYEVAADEAEHNLSCAEALEALDRGDLEAAAHAYFDCNEDCDDRCQLEEQYVDYAPPEPPAK